MSEKQPIIQRLLKPVIDTLGASSDWKPQLDDHYSIMDEPIQVERPQHNPNPELVMKEVAEQARQEFRMKRKSQI